MLDINKTNELLSALELENESYLNEQIIKSKYIKLSKKYHPDVCDELYKDGMMFKKINEAKSYLISNLDEVNQYLLNKEDYIKKNSYQRETFNEGPTYYYHRSPEVARGSFLLYFLSFLIPFVGLFNGMMYRFVNKKVSRTCFFMMALGIFVELIFPFLI